MTMTKMQKRITFGSLLILAMIGVGAAEWCAAANPMTAPNSLGSFDSIDNYWVGVPVTLILMGLVAVGWLEFVSLIRKAGLGALKKTGMVCCLILTIYPLLLHLNSSILSMHASAEKDSLLLSVVKCVNILLNTPIFILFFIVIFIAQMLTRQIDNAFKNIAGTLLGVVWIGLCAAVISTICITHIALLIIFLAAVKGTDIGAFFTGSAIGKNKLIPWLSPGKSWEGLVGGLAAAGVIAGVLGYYMTLWAPQTQDTPLTSSTPVWYWVVCGVILGAFGQFGDLCESLLKRAANEKDSGHLVPEFGGILDMIDSPLIAAPVMLVFMQLGMMFQYLN